MEYCVVHIQPTAPMQMCQPIPLSKSYDTCYDTINWCLFINTQDDLAIVKTDTLLSDVD